MGLFVLTGLGLPWILSMTRFVSFRSGNIFLISVIISFLNLLVKWWGPWIFAPVFFFVFFSPVYNFLIDWLIWKRESLTYCSTQTCPHWLTPACVPTRVGPQSRGVLGDAPANGATMPELSCFYRLFIYLAFQTGDICTYCYVACFSELTLFHIFQWQYAKWAFFNIINKYSTVRHTFPIIALSLRKVNCGTHLYFLVIYY